MVNKRALDLLKKYNQGKCTPEEAAIVETWFLEAAKNQKSQMPDADYETLKDKLWAGIKEQNKLTLKKRVLWPRFAAAASIIFCLSIGVYFLLHKSKPVQTVNIINRDIAPGGNKAILTLANGSNIPLTGSHNGKLAQQGNAAVIKTQNGLVKYLVTNQNEKLIAYNTITTPKGGVYHVVLADGSDVWLDAASSITYPVSFAGNDRTVKITGEAYFEIAHNAAKPFRVKSHGQTVEVLGTHFNINAYDDETLVKTTLLEGRVKVTTGEHIALLQPGQQSSVYPSGVFKGIENTDTDEAVAWKNGHFQFNKADLKTVMRQLARWYNVEVIYRGNIKERLFSGAIYKDISASKALDLISYEDVHFTIDGNKIIVSQ